MKAMVCEMCGSQEIIKQDGMYICQHCGTKYSIDEARKLIIEGKVDVSGSTVNINSQKKLDNLYILARRAKSAENVEDGAKYYNEICMLDPNSWEAAFYSVYYTSLQCRVGEAGSAATNIANCLDNVFDLITQNVEDKSEQIEILYELSNHSISASKILYSALWKMYQPNGYYNRASDFVTHSEPAKEILYRLESLIEMHFGTSSPYSDIIISLLKVEMTYTLSESQKKYSCVGDWDIQKIENRIKRLNPTYSAPIKQSTSAGSSGGCYIATAVYGSYDCPEVWTLRRFRDNTLAETWYGRTFIRTYYAISPTLVKWFGKTEWFKNMWKPILDQMVESLNRDGVDNTPYNDQNW